MDGTVINGAPNLNGGAEIVADEITGWAGSAAPRTSRPPRPARSGTYRSPTYRDARVITLAGWLWAPTPALRLAAEHRVAALCSAPDTLYPLRHNDVRSGEDLVATVELDGPVMVTTRTDHHAVWSVQLAAPDPLKYAPEPLITSTRLPIDGTGINWSTQGKGVDWTGGGRGGIDWGTTTSTGTAVLRNPGTAPSWPHFTITGPVNTPEITDTATGRTLRYSGTLTAGETLTIDTHPHRRTVRLDGTWVRPRLVSAEWFPLPPASRRSVSFRAARISREALLSIVIFSAYN
ncbi:phage tail family protein [Allokutzneria sp. A3M-2-11 16]|uniref:phage distal tail protein n=1 Tax=Allokutzneria sp. A3M-2-11 16 TaxID=2962043 RepID=UPI0020B7018D|nr:phage tail domain-containing protein [Allokutzneria sp. A3M-2-11 16]MCP3801858.1 phage tail family protein [Allokutzneria sp. A3M-2-11 16]